MKPRPWADLLLINARVLTMDPRRPTAEAVAVRGDRILAVGTVADLRRLRGPTTDIADAGGGVAIPAFHDAHCHILSYARLRSRVDCRSLRSIAAIGAAIAERAREVPPGGWVRAAGYDETLLAERRHPDRWDLDAAVLDRPVRLQHRTLHLDVLNTRGLALLGLLDATAPEVERDPDTGKATGRVYHGGELLRARWGGGGYPPALRLPRGSGARSPQSRQPSPARGDGANYTLSPSTLEGGVLNSPLPLDGGGLGRGWPGWNANAPLLEGSEADPEADLAADVRTASERLLQRGITTIQDATFTNGPGEWALFHRLTVAGDLRVRVVMFQDVRFWRGPYETDSQRGNHDVPSTAGARLPRVRLGPVKIMLDEGRSDVGEVQAAVADARAAGLAVAFHAVTEAEVAIARATRQVAPPRRRVGGLPPTARGPDRIEHGAIIPEALLSDVRAAGVAVVGQPALVHERGDVYLSEHSSETHGWLHRSRSLVRAGILYAAGSDAPVTDPSPALSLYAARTRRTIGGHSLGAAEALGRTGALAAHTLAPAQVVGFGPELGRLRPGALADIAVLDPEVVEAKDLPATARPVRLTIMEGQIVWRRPF